MRRYGVLDTGAEDAFDRITALAAQVLHAPMAVISLVDATRIWFKSRHGLSVDQVLRQPGLCGSTILAAGPRVVADALTDPECRGNQMVLGPLGVRFYAGVGLLSRDGQAVGALGVMDRVPRPGISGDDLATLYDLAALVVDELEKRPAPDRPELERASIDLRDRPAATRPPGTHSLATHSPATHSPATHSLTTRSPATQPAATRPPAAGQKRMAADLQQALIPPHIPTVAGLDLVGRYHAADGDVVGGDFFDVAPAAWGTALMIGDVCGKGHDAATEAGVARWTLRRLMAADPDPAGAMTALNSFLSRAVRTAPERGPDDRYVTAVAAAVRPRSGHTDMTLAVGGHPKPIVLHPGRPPQTVGATGPIIGWFEDCSYTATDQRLAPGDTLILYTDGLLGGDEDDVEDLAQSLAHLSDAPLPDLADALDRALDGSRTDDAAFLLARPT